MSRRRALLMALLSGDVLASKWYVINSATSDEAGRNTKTYYFAMLINATWYYYESDYPFYIVNNGTTYYLVYAYGYTLRSGSNYTTGSNFGAKNGIVYYKEFLTRSTTIQSKQDIYIWRA